MDKKKIKVNKNFTKLTHKGVSLIVLIVTVIVVIILAAVIILTINKNNILDSAKKSVILNDIATLREQIQIKKNENKYKDEKSDSIKLFGNIDDILGKEYKSLSKKYGVEADKLVYKDKAFNQKEIEVLEENGVEKESNYYLIMNNNTKESDRYKNSDIALTFQDLQNKINNKEFSSNRYNKAYIIEDIDIGARWNEGGTLIYGEAWTPITSIPQGTTLDGDNHRIKGIYINTSTRNQAFIKDNYGIIQNLIIDKECYFKGVDAFASILVNNKDNASVINCVNNADVITESDGWDRAGIVVYNYSKILKCKNYGDINKFNKGYKVAGICASNKTINSEINECENYGEITAGGYYIGGIAGYSAGGKISRCINYGNINTGSSCAGILGVGYGIIEYCVNYGNIKGTYNACGIIYGSTVSNIIVSNCYNLGDTYCYWNSQGCAGIINKNLGNIKNSYSIGKCYKGSQLKGYEICSTNEGVIENSYYLTQTLEDGTVLTEEFMKSDEFVNMLGEEYKKGSSGKNNGYPMLKWQF